MLVTQDNRIWVAIKQKTGYKLHSPVPLSLLTIEGIDRYHKGITQIGLKRRK